MNPTPNPGKCAPSPRAGILGGLPDGGPLFIRPIMGVRKASRAASVELHDMGSIAVTGRRDGHPIRPQWAHGALSSRVATLALKSPDNRGVTARYLHALTARVLMGVTAHRCKGRNGRISSVRACPIQFGDSRERPAPFGPRWATSSCGLLLPTDGMAPRQEGPGLSWSYGSQGPDWRNPAFVPGVLCAPSGDPQETSNTVILHV